MPKLKKGYLFCGEQDASVFSEPFIDYQQRFNELPQLLQRTYKAGDDRSFVIMSLNVAEKYLDTLLEALAPGYAALNENRDFTLSLKTEMLKALRLIPEHIIQGADLLRKVRNEFAHGIKYDSLEHLPPRLKQPMTNLVRELYGDEARHHTSIRETFKALAFVVFAGFQSYRVNFVALRERLEDGALASELKQECHKRFLDNMALRMSEDPVKIEDKGGWRYSYYKGGIVAIAPVDPENPPSSIALDAGSAP